MKNKKSTTKLELTIIIPCYNEESTILQLLDKVTALPLHNFEVLVVDDCSTDSSWELIQTIKDPRIKTYQLSTNSGKTAAIQFVLPKARGEYTIIQDADLEYNPSDIIPILETANSQNLDVVFGSRNLIKKHFIYPHYYAGGMFLTKVFNLLYRTKITDVTTCYKLLKTELIQDFVWNSEYRFGFCAEVAAQARNRSLQIAEVPIEYQPRSFREGKKIRPKDALEFLYLLFKHKYITK